MSGKQIKPIEHCDFEQLDEPFRQRINELLEISILKLRSIAGREVLFRVGTSDIYLHCLNYVSRNKQFVFVRGLVPPSASNCVETWKLLTRGGFRVISFEEALDALPMEECAQLLFHLNTLTRANQDKS